MFKFQNFSASFLNSDMQLCWMCWVVTFLDCYHLPGIKNGFPGENFNYFPLRNQKNKQKSRRHLVTYSLRNNAFFHYQLCQLPMSPHFFRHFGQRRKATRPQLCGPQTEWALASSIEKEKSVPGHGTFRFKNASSTVPTTSLHRLLCFMNL